MAGVNKVIIIGNLGRDPEIKYTQSNVPVANFTVATSESWKDKNSGEWQEKTEWHRIVAWRHLAEKAERSLKKGTQVYIEGKIETRKWTDKDGNDRYTTEIVADNMQMLGSREAAGGGDFDEPGAGAPPRAAAAREGGGRAPAKPAPNIADMDDDIPF